MSGPEVTIEPGRRNHCGQIVRRMRREHLQAWALMGLDPHQEVVRTFHASSRVQVGRIDGALAAMWGIIGTLAAPYAGVWVVLTNLAVRHPRLVLGVAREQLASLVLNRHELQTVIIPADRAALRFAVHLGFHRSFEGMLHGPAASPAARRAMIDRIRSDPDIRLPYGSSFAVRMGYHGEA